MSNFLPAYGHTTGPLGVPCIDQQAFDLDRLCRSLDNPELKRLTVPTLDATATKSARTDESWISAEDIDRDRETVLSSGLDPSHFLRNPIVALNHAYWLPPVGKCTRIWEHKSEERSGIKALTHYLLKPDDFAGEWNPDEVWALVQAGVLNGKFVGFLPTKRRDASEHERAHGITRVIEKWLLLEHSVCPIGLNPFAVTSSVSKSTMRALDYDISEPKSWTPRDPEAEPERIASHTRRSPTNSFMWVCGKPHGGCSSPADGQPGALFPGPQAEPAPTERGVIAPSSPAQSAPETPARHTPGVQ